MGGACTPQSIVASAPDGTVSRGQRIEPDNVTRVSSIPFCDDVLDPSVPVLQLVDVSKQLGVVITRVHQMLRDRQILAIKRDGVLAVPEAFFGEDGHILKSVPGLIAVLHDGGFRDDEILTWLFREDDSLEGGSPAAALHTHSAREVVRRAQALGF